MPANLPPQYFEVEKQYRLAKEPEEKLAYLRQLLSIVPKHKGTEKLQAELKRKIAKLTDQIEQIQKSSKKRPSIYRVERTLGVPQVVIVGPPNSGKSQLISALTNARPAVTPYPYATQMPVPGMMDYQDIQIQLIDTMSITADDICSWVADLVRATDATMLVVDLGAPDCLDQLEGILERFDKMKIEFVKEKAPKREEEEDEQVIFGKVIKPAILIGNKSDLDTSGEMANLLKEFYQDKFNIIIVSALEKTNLESLKEAIFNVLSIIRIYTKVPGKPPDKTKPYVLPKGSTVYDVARAIHHELAETFRTARVWGSTRFEGQFVERDYVVADQDIVEIHR